jgi:hypothetical protein
MPQEVKEIDVFNKHTNKNALKIVLITLAIAIFMAICIFCFVKILYHYSVSYETNGGLVFGEELKPDYYDFLQKTVEPKDVRKSGYYLEGWYTDPKFQTRYKFGSRIWNNVKLYAKWEEGYALILQFANDDEAKFGMTLDEVKLYHEIYVKPGTTCSLPTVFNTVGRGEHCKNDIENHLGEQLLWYENRECTGEPLFTKDYIMTKNINVYGKWFDTKLEKFEIDGAQVLQKYLGYCSRIYLPSEIYAIKDIPKDEFIASPSTQLGDQAKKHYFSAFTNVLKNLEEVYINSEMTYISRCAFKNCENLQYVHFPSDSKITEIREYAFQDCANLKTIALPSSATKVGQFAFHNNWDLETLIVGDNVKTIENNAFQNCKSLKEVYLPNVKTLNAKAFNECSKLTKFTLGTKSQVQTNATLADNILTTDQDVFGDFEFYVPQNLLNYYKTTSPWSAYAVYMKGM